MSRASGSLLLPLVVAVVSLALATVFRLPAVVPAGITGGFCTWSVAGRLLRARADRAAKRSAPPAPLAAYESATIG